MTVLSDNRSLFDKLVADGAIDVDVTPFFDSAPPPLPDGFDFDRVEGMLLGLAIGNALAMPTEGLLPEQRRARFGEIRDYVPNPRAGGRRAGTPMVDTQLAFWTLEELLVHGRLDPERLALRFVADPMIAVGDALATFVDNMRAGRAWYKAGAPSAGNGALMRIAPVLLPHLQHPSPDLWVDTVLAATVTHNDAASNSACVAFVDLLWRALGASDVPEPRYWVDRYVEVARDIEPPTSYRPFNGAYTDFSGSLWEFVDKTVPPLLERDLPVVEACEAWWSGAFLLETVPSVLYILAKHGNDFEEAVVRAVNDTWDNDTHAAIVGAVTGALHGRRGIPQRWIDGLLGRVGHDDDGRVFELVDAARKTWAPPLADGGLEPVGGLCFLWRY